MVQPLKIKLKIEKNFVSLLKIILRMGIKKIAVFCGSKGGNKKEYEEAARELGVLMAKKGIKLVYGGGNKGMMGAVANSVMENNGQVLGIIPQLLTEWEQQHEGISELRVVENMHVRKRMLYENADAVVILPGGYGTLDELFEVLTWNQLSIHHKKVFILNTANFYDPLVAHLKNMQQEGFLYHDISATATIVMQPEEIFIEK